MTKAKVIVVQNENIVAKDLEARLEGLGYTVCANVISGLEAIEQMEIHQPDLVLMDVVLQGKTDGIDAAVTIRSRWNTPVIFITSYFDETRLEQAKLAEPFGYLVKPFKDAEIKAAIEMTLHRSQVEENLRKNEGKLRILSRVVEQSPAVVIITDFNGNIEYVSPKFTQLTGYNLEEAARQKHQLLMSIPQLSEIYHNIWKTISSGRYWRGEIQYQKNGEPSWWHTSISPIKNDSGIISHYLGILEETTPRKQAEGKIKRSKELVDTILNSLAEPISLIDVNTYKVIEANQLFLSKIGLPESSAAGMACHEIIHRLPKPCHHFGHMCPLLNTQKTGRPSVTEHLFFNENGQETHVEVNTFPVKDETGRVTQVVRVEHDITLHKQTKEALQKAKETAEATSRAKSEFLANISHELRTPLSPIIGMTDLVLGTNLDNEQRELLGLARNAAVNLLSMIDDLIELGRLEAENIKLDEYNLDVALLIESALKNRADEAKLKGLKLTRHIEPNVPREIVGDPYYLLQILNKILENAVKFTEKGEVRVTVAKGLDDGDVVTLHFSVSDTGIVIPAHRLDDLSQLFTQADASMSRKFGGLGIGLTMVRRLVELMGGEFWAESTEGEGSTFYFTLPLRPAQSGYLPG